MAVYESGEDYLERILMLEREKGEVRSVDIAHALDVSKPSVSHAMKLLRERGYITMDESNLIELTASGREVAERMLERHMTLARFLMGLGVPEDIAYQDACKMEHDLSDESFLAICRLSNESCPAHQRSSHPDDGKQAPSQPHSS